VAELFQHMTLESLMVGGTRHACSALMVSRPYKFWLVQSWNWKRGSKLKEDTVTSADW